MLSMAKSQQQLPKIYMHAYLLGCLIFFIEQMALVTPILLINYCMVHVHEET